MSDNLKVTSFNVSLLEDLKAGKNCAREAATAIEQLEAEFASQQAAHEAEIARLKEENARQHKEILVYHESRLALICEKEALAKQLSAANKACAMKDEALKELRNQVGYSHLIADIDAALSSSQQEVSEWERKQLEPLRAQVAMLTEELESISPSQVCKWIIERGSPAEYAYIEDAFDDEMTFSTDTTKAFKFDTEQDAIDYAEEFKLNEFRVCQHIFIMHERYTQATAKQFIAECEQRGAVKARAEDESLLTWLQDNPAYTVELCDEGEGEEIWIVHKESGGVNDREWSEAGRGYSIREALRDAQFRATSKKAGTTIHDQIAAAKAEVATWPDTVKRATDINGLS